jgi:uncharacterized protein (DUF433 family)
MKYTTINIQGNLISEEILQKIEKAEAQGQLATDFGFDPGSNIRSEIEYSWSRIKLDWKNFNNKSQILPASDPYGTSLSRKWMEQFLSSIGFDLSRQKSSLIGDNNQSYSISNTAENIDNLPVHIVGFIEPTHPDKNTLDIKTSGGTTRFSPHGTMQEYLNVTEHIYGIATNGLYLRLIRDCGRLIKLTYVEFDIKRMMDEDKYSEFTLLYRLLHASRFPRNKAEADQCLLEKYYQDSIETGNRIRDGLSKAVKLSLEALGNGFIQHESNIILREKIKSGDLSSKDYYRQLLRVIYRFLFLMVTEERDLVYDPDDKTESTQKLKKIYLQFYSIARLRKLSENRYVYEAQFNDLWQGLVNTFRLFEGGGNGIKLGIQPLDGDLFNYRAIRDLQESIINNKLLLECVRNLNEFQDQNKNLVPINYRSLDVEELGSVYEGLLELHPVIENIEATNPSHINFTFHEGTDRKTTGSYYTRPDLVNELIKSALIPVIEERLKANTGNKEAQAKALLKLKVCDAAAGSGHMLLAAARTIAWYLARVQSGEENPAPSIYRKCLREVIQHCIYAVDYNPDAVELCKLALWLEGHNSGKPLSFLDHKIRNGNSLVGVTDLSVLQKGIPDNAFNAVTGDDKTICQELKKENAKYNKTKQVTLDFDQTAPLDTKSFTGDYKVLEDMEQDDLEGVKQVKTRFDKLRSNHIWFKEWRACNLWTAAFFWNYTEENKKAAPNSERLEKFLNHPAAAYGPMIGKADALSMEHKFFHWPLEFPDVFEHGGFDVMLGNPPWERIKLQEQEYFSTRDSNIANARTAAERKNAIKLLPQTNPSLYQEYINSCHDAEANTKFIRESGNFKLTARGDINTYAIFAELFYKNISSIGFASVILPTGIATDSTTSLFFSTLMEGGNIKSLYDFVNEKMLFPDVLHNFHFSMFTITGEKRKNKTSDFSFNNQLVEHLQQEIRHFSLSSSEIKIVNPESKTLPVLTSKYDSKIILKVHNENNILAKEGSFPKVWNTNLFSLFHMTNDSGLFLNQAENGTVPLYESKMFYQYDHRYGTYNSENDERLHMLPKTELYNYVNPEFSVSSSFYVPRIAVEDRVKDNWKYNWFLAFRAISSAQLERTFTATIIPFCGVGNSSILINPVGGNSLDVGMLLSVFNSIPFDYVTRQKASGANLNFFKVRQLPLPSPKVLKDYYLLVIPIIIELTYTGWDIKVFADDIWKEAGDELKVVITKQWEENKKDTGSHEWAPPDWCEIDNEGCPLPPFKWDEERRAVLKAKLDAIYAKLYGLTTEELRYILDPQDVYGEDFPGETFRVLKDKEMKLYGEYRTRRLVLDAFNKLNTNIHSQTPIDSIEINRVTFIDNNTSMKEFSLNEGIYSVIDAANIIKQPIDKVRRWFKKLSEVDYEGLDGSAKIDIEKRRISFHGLIELVVIGTLLDNGFTIKNIVKARTDLKAKSGKDYYPFATNNVKDDLKVAGHSILFQFPHGTVTLDGTGQYNLDIIKQFFKDIVFENDIAMRIIPQTGKGEIIIDPKFAGGKPSFVKHNDLEVEMIMGFYDDEDSIAELMENYSLSREEIEAALNYCS